MTTVTFSDTAIRATDHAGRTPICVAVGAVLQTAMRILNRGYALESGTITPEPPRLDIVAAVGDMPPMPEFTAGAMLEFERLGRQRKGRIAFVQATFAGAYDALLELEAMAPHSLKIVDDRTEKPKEPIASTWQAQVAETHDPDLAEARENERLAQEV